MTADDLDFSFRQDREGSRCTGHHDVILPDTALGRDRALAMMYDLGFGSHGARPAGAVVADLHVLGDYPGAAKSGDGGSPAGSVRQREGHAPVGDAERVEQMPAYFQRGGAAAVAKIVIMHADEARERTGK